MEFVWASVLFVGVVCTADIIYEICQTLNENNKFYRKASYPLNFDNATGFHFIEDQNEKNSYSVFDSNNHLVFRIFQRPRQKSIFKQKWVFTRPTDENELASVTFGCLLGRNQVSFNLINRYSNPPQIISTSHVNSGIQISAAPLSGLTTRSNTTPYIDSSLFENFSISREQLGNRETLKSNTDLRKFEERKLYKINVEMSRMTKSSKFKISKNSMRYIWKANGYLEKSPKNNSDLSCERIGIVRFKNVDGSDFWLYINEGRIEAIVGIATAFLQYKKSMWRYKNLLHLS